MFTATSNRITVPLYAFYWLNKLKEQFMSQFKTRITRHNVSAAANKIYHHAQKVRDT